MKLLAYSINGIQYLVNQDQIKQAGSLKAAAEKMAGFKPEVKKPEGEKPNEK